MSDPVLQLQPIESPCIQVCSLNDQGICIGCFRTTAEIGDWLNLSARHRKRIMDDLPERAERMFGAD